MILEEATIPALTDWIVSHIEPIIQGDPSILAKYIVALLKNDKPKNELEEQLFDFLNIETTPFVNQLLEVLKEEPAGSGKRIFFDPNSEKVHSTGNGKFVEGESQPQYEQHEQEDQDSDRDHKHARKDNIEYEINKRRRQEEKGDELRKRRSPDRYHRREKYSPSKDDQEYDEKDSRYYNRRDRYDPKRRRRYEKFNSPKRQERCRDYDEMGFCKKGELCPYDHGSNPIVVTDLQILDQIKRTQDSQDRVEKRGESYDPETPLFQNVNMGNKPFISSSWNYPVTNFTGSVNLGIKLPMVNLDMNHLGINSPLANISSLNRNSDNDTIVQVGGKGMRKPSEKRDKDRDQQDIQGTESRDRFKGRTNPFQNTLVISSVPPELNNIDKLNSHFKQFGSIVNIQVKPHQNRAFVQFSQYSDAEKALNSTEAVLGNRFIRIFWSKKSERHNEKETLKQELPQIVPPKVIETTKPKVTKKEEKLKNFKELQHQKLDLRKSQLEQTKTIIESLSKTKNIDPQERALLMKKLSSLTNTVASTLAKDTTKIEKSVKNPKSVLPSRSQAEKDRLDRELEILSQLASRTESTPAPAPLQPNPTSPSNLDKLQKKYTTLKKMAASLGIDESFRGRSKRGRGTKVMRGRPKKTMVLDNRSTTIRIFNLPQELRDSTVLSNHFRTFGEITNIVVQNETALIQFASRRAAEMALTKGKTFYSHNLHMNWNNTKTETTDQEYLESNKEENLDEELVQEEVYQPETEYFEEEDTEERSWKRQQ